MLFSLFLFSYIYSSIWHARRSDVEIWQSDNLTKESSSSAPTHKLNVPTEPLPWGIEREYGHNSFLEVVSAPNLRLGRIHSTSNPTVSQVAILHFSRFQRLSLDVTQHSTAKYCDCCCRVILISSKDVVV